MWLPIVGRYTRVRRLRSTTTRTTITISKRCPAFSMRPHKYYSEWFAPYPWKELKLSEFPAYATYAQGFPTNITFSENLGFLTRSDEKSNAVLLVTAHESAHQWWGNLLTPGKGPGGNILSEGMSHFASLLLVEQLEGEGARNRTGENGSRRATAIGGARTRRNRWSRSTAANPETGSPHTTKGD